MPLVLECVCPWYYWSVYALGNTGVGQPVFLAVSDSVIKYRIGSVTSPNIWEETVVYDELTINERQKGDKDYMRHCLMVLELVKLQAPP